MITGISSHIMPQMTSTNLANRNKAVEGSPREEASESASQKMIEAQKKVQTAANQNVNNGPTMIAASAQGAMAVGNVINALV